MSGNPELASAARELLARDGRVVQARALPNPEISVVVENFGGDDVVTGGEQSTLQVGQLFELGGERSARVQSARGARDVAHWEYESKRLDVLTRARQAFLEVLAGQRRLELADESVTVSEEVARAVAARVEAGKVSPIEQTRAEVALATERIDRDRAKSELSSARTRLAAMWGSNSPAFDGVAGDLAAVPVVPSYESVLEHAVGNPDLSRWMAAIVERESAVQLERARAIPDVTLAGGIRRFELGDDAYIATATIPLPLFDRNRGALQEARERLAGAQEDQRAADVRIRQLLAETYERLVRADSEVRNIRDGMVPGAESVFAAVSEGYRLGKFGYLEVLDTRRTLAAARAQLVRAQADFHHAFAELDRLTGKTPIDTTDRSNSNDEK
ncbi:MAG: TolC family protein [Thermoanaerobaculia bacterium]|nr:TolC family protein [Thermoanaerobaculia bacterium]